VAEAGAAVGVGDVNRADGGDGGGVVGEGAEVERETVADALHFERIRACGVQGECQAQAAPVLWDWRDDGRGGEHVGELVVWSRGGVEEELAHVVAVEAPGDGFLAIDVAVVVAD